MILYILYNHLVVLNKQHQVVAVNNSSFSLEQGFNYGVRLKYLIELINKIQKTKK